MSREMLRGAVYLEHVELPHSLVGGSGTQRAKYLVVLQGGASFALADNVAVLIASTRRSPKPARPFEVFVGTNEGFDHDTVIDGRWVLTCPKSELHEIKRLTVLPLAVMDRVSVAVVAGLQL